MLSLSVKLIFILKSYVVLEGWWVGEYYCQTFLFFCNKGAVLFMDILTVMVRSHPMTLHGATFTMWQHYVVDSLCGLTMNSCGVYMCRDFVNMLQVKIMMMFLFYLNMYKCYKYCTVCDVLMLFLSGLNENKSKLKDFFDT